MVRTERSQRNHLGSFVAHYELMQLEMFVAVVEEQSFLRAAERVFRTQPAVSCEDCYEVRRPEVLFHDNGIGWRLGKGVIS